MCACTGVYKETEPQHYLSRMFYNYNAVSLKDGIVLLEKFNFKKLTYEKQVNRQLNSFYFRHQLKIISISLIITLS